MVRIPVSVQPRPYEVLIERGLMSRAGEFLYELFPYRNHCFVVTVPAVRKKWAKKLMDSLSAVGWNAKLLEMPDGERYKTLSTIEQLAEKLVGLGADRRALVVALGGGVVGDVAGLLASLYMRGVDVIQVPTTVLAQVDASIGGKTGVDLKAGKNLVGTFHQPRAVLIDPDVLSTLPEREFRSGLYEVLKAGVIGRPQLFESFERERDAILRREPEVIDSLIAESVKLKAEVVSADEREGGLRQVLNFGHTIGHALETETDYRGFLHGEAVAWGMIAAANIAAAVGKSSATTASRISRGVLGLGRLPKVEVRGAAIVRRLQTDKKTKDGVVHFILPRQIGQVEIVNDVPREAVLDAVEGIRRESQK
jgi:3-dehydroquinate synthase